MKRVRKRGECTPKSVPASSRSRCRNSSRVGADRSSATSAVRGTKRYRPSVFGTGPNRSIGELTSAAAAVIASGETLTSISASSHSMPAGSPGKPMPSSLRTALRPPSQPTR